MKVTKVEYKDKIEWQNNLGECHREDGLFSAVEYASGTKEWYLDGKLHREDGPAVEYSNGDKHWYKNGKRHRLDGPAIEFADGDKYWFLNGEKYSEEQWEKETLKLKLKRLSEL